MKMSRKKKTKITGIIIAAATAAFATTTTLMAVERNKQINDYVVSDYVKVNDNIISLSEYRYVYWQELNAFNNEYAEYLTTYGIDTSKDYHLQPVTSSSKQTWGDVIDKRVFSTIAAYTALYNSAKAENFYSEKTAEKVESLKSSFKSCAASENVSVDTYASTHIVNGCTLEHLETYMEKQAIAELYANAKEAEVIVTEEDIQNHYEENKKEYDIVQYRYFAFSPSDYDKKINEANGAVTTEDILKWAKEDALKFYENVFDEETFIKNCVDFSNEDIAQAKYIEKDGSLITGGSYNNTDTEVAEWLFDDARKYGDVSVVYSENKQTYYVIYFIKREKDISKTINARLIYLPYDKKATNTFLVNEDVKKATQKEAETILEKYNENPSETTFANLALSYSKDVVSSNYGGLWTNVSSTSFAPSIANWILQEEHKENEIEQIDTAEGIYIIMFLSYNEDVAWKTNVEKIIRQNQTAADVGISADTEITVEYIY